MESINSLEQLQALGLGKPTSNSNKTQDDKNAFLKLFITQLQNQDPLNPQEGGELLSQLAQFSTVEGINNIEDTFGRMEDTFKSSQALQATSLVGRKVQVTDDYGVLQPEGTISGVMDVPRAVSDLSVTITDNVGQVVKQINIGEAERGERSFVWDGTDNNGDRLDPGVYHVVANATIDGEGSQLTTYVNADVESVTIGSGANNVLLNLLGHGQRSLADVRTIN